MPLLQSRFTDESATKVALLSGSAIASAHFKNKLVTVRIIEFFGGCHW